MAFSHINPRAEQLVALRGIAGWRSAAVSRQAIAAVLARQDLSSGERLVAFSLARFADRDGRARPGTPAAAGRAGLKRSWFLEARDILERRGLVVVEDSATGRGRASTLWLPFADEGPWWEGEINAELFEAVLGYSRSQGTVRLLLAAMAALADSGGSWSVSPPHSCAPQPGSRIEHTGAPRLRCSPRGSWFSGAVRAAGATRTAGRFWIRDRGWRCRAGGSATAGPACWTAAVARERRLAAGYSGRAGRRDGRRPGRRGSTRRRGKGGGERTVSGQKRPVTAGVSGRKGGGERTLSPVNHPASAGVSVGKGGADRTVSRRETPAETPAPNAGAGREPQNPRTIDPPNPP